MLRTLSIALISVLSVAQAHSAQAPSERIRLKKCPLGTEEVMTCQGADQDGDHLVAIDFMNGARICHDELRDQTWASLSTAGHEPSPYESVEIYRRAGGIEYRGEHWSILLRARPRGAARFVLYWMQDGENVSEFSRTLRCVRAAD